VNVSTRKIPKRAASTALPLPRTAATASGAAVRGSGSAVEEVRFVLFGDEAFAAFSQALAAEGGTDPVA